MLLVILLILLYVVACLVTSLRKKANTFCILLDSFPGGALRGHFITFSQFEGHLRGFKSSSEGRFIHWKVTPEGSLLMKGLFCALAV